MGEKLRRVAESAWIMKGADRCSKDLDGFLMLNGNGMNAGWVCSVGMWYGGGASEFAARQAVVNNCIVSTQGAEASTCQLAMGSAIYRQR